MLHSCRCHKYSLTTMFVAYLAYWEYHLHLGLWKKWLLIHSPFFLVFPINLLQVVFCLPCEWIDKNCKSVIYYLIVIEYKVSFQHSIGESKTVINRSLLLYIILLNYLQDKLASVLRCFRQFVSVMLLKDDEYGETREKFWLKKVFLRTIQESWFCQRKQLSGTVPTVITSDVSCSEIGVVLTWLRYLTVRFHSSCLPKPH